jgi:hypothetical protein
MTETRCSDCGRRRSLRFGDCQDTGNCIDYLKTQLASAQAELAAWRALVAWAKENKSSATIYGVALVAGNAHSMTHDPVEVAARLGLPPAATKAGGA